MSNNEDFNAENLPKSSQPIEKEEFISMVAAIKEQHRIELERLEQDLRTSLFLSVKQAAQERAKEQLESWQKLIKEQKQESIQLHKRIKEMESLQKRQLKIENQQLQERLRELENMKRTSTPKDGFCFFHHF
ncbi:hypothetical protein [Komarekiella delphini-convector]|uniref:hypothetical protein n=1 Tax=Komarekiella delphini-convector TaxID=3050158 RepID=UPI001782CCEB|nr:hypothetical protein [Komarekiella delphini-convector]